MARGDRMPFTLGSTVGAVPFSMVDEPVATVAHLTHAEGTSPTVEPGTIRYQLYWYRWYLVS